MKEYEGTRGNLKYLLNESFNEACAFDTFGELKSIMNFREASILLHGIKQEVNIVSILGRTLSNVCELYYMGCVSMVNLSYIDCFTTIRDNVILTGKFYRIDRPENIHQILIPLNVNTMSREEIATLVGIKDWETLK